LIVTEAILHI